MVSQQQATSNTRTPVGARRPVLREASAVGASVGVRATLPPGAGVMIPGRREAVTVLRGPYTLQAVSVMA